MPTSTRAGWLMLAAFLTALAVALMNLPPGVGFHVSGMVVFCLAVAALVAVVLAYFAKH
jgi:hypothetical protein